MEALRLAASYAGIEFGYAGALLLRGIFYPVSWLVRGLVEPCFAAGIKYGWERASG